MVCPKGKKLIDCINKNNSTKCVLLNEDLQFYLDKIVILKIDNRLMEDYYINNIKELANQYNFLLRMIILKVQIKKNFLIYLQREIKFIVGLI